MKRRRKMRRRINSIRQKVSDHNLIRILGIVLLIAIATSILSLNKSIKIEKRLDFAQTMSKHVESFNILKLDNRRFATGFHMKFGNKVFMITNRHVCDSNIKVVHPKLIQFENHLETIIAIDQIHDLCMTTSNRTDGLPLSMDPPELLEVITLIGFPRGIQKTVREGRIIGDETISVLGLEGTNRTISTQISAPAYGGNSGSPVINANGEVVGVLHAGSPYFPLEPFIVPHRFLKAFILNTLLQIPYEDSIIEEASAALNAKESQVIPGNTLYSE